VNATCSCIDLVEWILKNVFDVGESGTGLGEIGKLLKRQKVEGVETVITCDVEDLQ